MRNDWDISTETHEKNEVMKINFQFLHEKKIGHKRKIDSTLKGIAGHIQKENKTHLM